MDTTKTKSCSPIGETVDIEVVRGYPDKKTKIGKYLPDILNKDIIELICEYLDIFAWDPNDMPGIPETIARHSLHVDPGVRPVCQKKRIFSEEKLSAIDEELNRLLEAGFIEPVKFPTWIANMVLVKKSKGKYRMCIDYSDLKKACPKDYYPLPNIDQLIDATAGHELLSFMDAFS